MSTLIGVNNIGLFGGNSSAKKGKKLPYDAEIEYLESTVPPSEAYIDTGINYNSLYAYEITFATGDFNNSIWGARITTNWMRKGNHTITYVSHGRTCIYSSEINASSFVDFLYSNNKHTILYQQSETVLLYDGVGSWNMSWITEDIVPLNTYLFGYNNAGNIGGARTNYLNIYAYKVKDKDGNLIQDFIPVRVGNVGYFYDKVSGELFGNSSTGEFVLGPDVE